MTIEIFIVFCLIGLALYLFISEKLPVDITSFLLMVTLLFLGIIYPHSFPNVTEGLSGLSNPATVTILAMFILSGGIQRTGLVQQLGRKIFPLVGKSETRQLFGLGVITAPLSGFINNTATVAILLPMVMDMAKRSGTAATKLLIPLSFFGMLGGTLTLVGSSTNILASSLLNDSGVLERGIGMFDFTKLGLLVLGVGSLYLFTVGRWLLPDRKSTEIEEDPLLFFTEILVLKGSPNIGKCMREAKFLQRTDVELIKVVRGRTSYVQDAHDRTICEGDVLVIRATEQQIIDIARFRYVKVLRNFDKDTQRHSFSTGKIVQLLLKNKTAFNQKEIKDVNFWEEYGVKVIGINHDEIDKKNLNSSKIYVGDILLAHVSDATFRRIKRRSNFVVLKEVEDAYSPEDTTKMLLIILGVILGAAFLGIPIVVTALAGVVAMVLCKCVDPLEMYKLVNWEIIFLLAGVIPLGIALQKTGAADFIASFITSFSGEIPPLVLLMLIYLLTTLLTEIISNNAAVVILVPIALSVSMALGLNPYAFVLAVMFAASTSFLSPVGYQTNTMVYARGNYQFSDFIRVGAPLNLILLVVTCLAINHWWPLVV